ncbi:MAG: MFS transporter [Anaerolineae bacterium]|nr:MFS transporter [Anaerolineae bacterium]
MEKHSSDFKLDYKKTFLIGFGFFGLSVMWKLYNDYVPIFLQAGNPVFDADLATRTNGFGLGAALTGFIMTLDNIVALFLLPLIGIWSDRVWTKLGRRKPFIMGLAPISIVTFIIIPFIIKAIPPDLSGNTAELSSYLWLFVVIVGIFITTMAGFRTPVISLMPDLTPSPLRSQANGIINLMGGLGGVIITLIGAWLYAIDIVTPFVFAGILMIAALFMLFFFVQEPRYLEDTEEREEEQALGVLKGVRSISGEERKSLLFLMLAIFLWFVGYNAIETFFTSYGVNVLKIKENQASLLSSVAYITFLLFSVPSGFIAAKLGRRRTITVGLLVFAGLLLVGYLVPNIIVIGAALGLGGLAWSLVNINSLPMVVDISSSNAHLGTFTGFYYLASQLAAIVGPTLNGFVIERSGNYGLTLLMPVIFFILAAVVMQNVRRGEAR